MNLVKKILVAACALAFVVGCDEKKEAQPVKQDQPVVKEEAKQETPKRIVAHVDVPTVDWAKAFDMVQAGGQFLDVRNPEELREGYAPKTLRVPLSELKNRMGELPKDKDLLVYCRSGRRSEVAVKLLMNAGYDRVYNVKGGYMAYPQK